MRLCLLTLFIVLSGCSVAPLTLRTDKVGQDAFKDESFFRYSHGRLKKLQETGYKGLGQCHQGKYEEGLEMLKKEAMTNQQRPDYWNQVGLCYLMARNYTKASFYFEFGHEESSQTILRSRAQ